MSVVRMDTGVFIILFSAFFYVYFKINVYFKSD